jgi:FAD/FMN-containing dehydrogenase
MTQTISDLDALRAAMGGPVFVAGDDGYEQARAIWNGDIDRRPAVVTRVHGPTDIAVALAYARTQGLEVAVRGGGHGYWGAAVPERGLMIDLSALDTVAVDPQARRARCGGGASLAQLDAAT